MLDAVGALPFHAEPICDLVEEAAVTILAKFKDEAVRLTGSRQKF